MVNWHKLVKEGLIKVGATLLFSGKTKSMQGTVLEDGTIACEEQTFKRPGQVWSKYFKESRRESWMDAVSLDGLTVRAIRQLNPVCKRHKYANIALLPLPLLTLFKCLS